MAKKIFMVPHMGTENDEAVAPLYPAQGHPWADYLEARMRLLAMWRDEGKTPEECVSGLLTDPGQIRLLWATYDQHLANRATPDATRGGGGR